MEAIRNMIKGTEIELEELEEKADKDQIQKVCDCTHFIFY